MAKAKEVNQDTIMVPPKSSRKTPAKNKKAPSPTPLEEAVEEVDSPEIPEHYVEIPLCSLGKTEAPKVLHFRNYTLEETAELTLLTEENQYQIFSKVLNKMIFEDFDCRQLSPEEMIQILLHIYATWWNPFIECQQYYVNPDLPEEKLKDKTNVSLARVRIGSLKFEDLHQKEFKTPFTITTPDGRKVKLRFPVVRDYIVTQKYLAKTFAEEDTKYRNTMKHMEAGTATVEEMEGFSKFLSHKTREGLITQRAQAILTVNDEDLSLQEKINFARSLDFRFWEKYSQLQKKYTYGLITDDVSFECTVTGNTIRRDLRRPEPVDLLPTVRESHDSGFEVSFD